MKKIAMTVASTALALTMFGGLPAQAASGVEVGRLTCSEQASWGFIVGSSRRLNCRFDRDNTGQTEWYTGHVSKLGLDLGHTKSGVITWEVIAPSSDMSPGALQGTYGGLQASLALGNGAGANAMVGGFDRAVTLQPLSVEGLKGTELAAGLGSMDLKFRG